MMAGVPVSAGSRLAVWRMLVDAKLRRGDAGLDDALDGDVPALHGQAAQRALQLVERQAGVEQRARESCRPAAPAKQSK